MNMTSEQFSHKLANLKSDVVMAIEDIAAELTGPEVISSPVNVAKYTEDDPDIASFDYELNGDIYRLEKVLWKSNTILFYNDPGNETIRMWMFDLEILDLIHILRTLEDIKESKVKK